MTVICGTFSVLLRNNEKVLYMSHNCPEQVFFFNKIKSNCYVRIFANKELLTSGPIGLTIAILEGLDIVLISRLFIFSWA